MALVVTSAMLLKSAFNTVWLYFTTQHSIYNKHQRASVFSFKYAVLIRSASAQAHKEWKSFSRWALSSASCLSYNWFLLLLNHVFWKHCYYPPVAYCTDECFSTFSPMFPSQSLSKCWINQAFNSRSYHEAAKPHFQFLKYPCCFFPTKKSLLCGFWYLSHRIISTLAEAFTWLLYILINLVTVSSVPWNFCKFCLCSGFC